MSVDLGDRTEDSLIYFMWSTNAADGSSITRATDGTISVYKNDDLTQSVAGITDTEDFDSLTGIHLCKIDTSADAFYATTEDYTVVLSGATIDGKSVNAVLAVFSIENRFMRGTESAALATGVQLSAQGKLDVNAECDTALADYDSPTKAESDASFNLVIADTEDIQTQVGAAGAGLTDIGGMSTGMKGEVNAECDTALTDYDAPTKTEMDASFNALNNVSSADVTTSCTSALNTYDPPTKTEMDASFNSLNDISSADVNAACDTSLTDYDAPTKTEMDTSFNSVITEVNANETKIDTIDGVVDTILVDTNELQTNQGNWVTATGFSTHSAADIWSVATRILTANTNFNDLTASEMKAEAVAALADIKLDHLVNSAVDTNWATTVHLDSVIGHLADVGTAATFDRTTDAQEAIRNRGDTAWVTGAGGSDRLLMVDTTIATLASQTSFTLTAGSADDDAYNNCTIIIEDASTATQKAMGIVSAYTGATKTVTLKYDPAVFTMDTTDKVYILAENALKATLANRQLNVAADGDIAGNIDGSVASVVGHTAQTGDSFAIVNHADHGNAKLVRSTAPANTLDVSATGEAGLDFANIKNATGAHTLTNITVPTVSTLTGKSGFALSATGANSILKDSTFALAMADAIWDEILSGTTHNIASSAGRRIRETGAYAVESGTAQAGDTYSITLAATASATDGVYNRNLVVLVDNTGVGQTRTIVDYDGTTKVAVIDRDWRVTPDNTTVYQVTADNTPLVVDQGVAQSGTATTIKLRAYASSTNNIYLCNVVAIIAGTGRGQARLVGAYDGTSKVATICGDNWVTNPDNTSVYVLMPYGTTCTSCVGTYALGQINTECDTALSDYGANTTVPDAAGTAATLHGVTDGKVDTVDSNVDAILVDTGTAGVVVASGSKTGYALSAAGIDSIHDEIIEGTLTHRQMQRIMLAALAGKSTGGGTATLTFRDDADGKARITATVDVSGNRTAITKDGE